MLYSPTLHQIRNAVPSSFVGSVNAYSAQMIVVDGVSLAAKRIAARQNVGLETFWFDCVSGVDQNVTMTAALTTPKFTTGWPFRWAFKGGFASCFSGTNINPGANFCVTRNGVNVFTNSPAISSLGPLIVSGTALLGRSNYVNAHASHAIWERGDVIAVFVTAMGSNWRGGKVYVDGARIGF